MCNLIAYFHDSSNLRFNLLNVCIQPSAARVFQRVKVEEVKLLDERLADNSYWAKVGLLAYFRHIVVYFLYLRLRAFCVFVVIYYSSAVNKIFWRSLFSNFIVLITDVMGLYVQSGADEGWGAKAEEVLGRVRGK